MSATERGKRGREGEEERCATYSYLRSASAALAVSSSMRLRTRLSSSVFAFSASKRALIGASSSLIFAMACLHSSILALDTSSFLSRASSPWSACSSISSWSLARSSRSTSSGADSRAMRTAEHASSMQSMAESGRRREVR